MKSVRRRVMIDRAKWRPENWGLRPEEDLKMGDGELYNIKDKMCCLGFALNQLANVPRNELLNRSMPSSLGCVISNFSEKTPTGIVDSPLSKDAAKINDNANLPLEEKEAAIRALFKSYGLSAAFTGEYPKFLLKADKRLRARLEKEEK